MTMKDITLEELTAVLAGKQATEKKSDLKFVFVHGLNGWGSYDKVNRFFPYWGMSKGDLMKDLKKHGFPVYAASVSPVFSAWDRACELYAQLAGTVTDYGEEHSRRCGHARFGKDFRNCPLIDDFEHSVIVLFGHSFGGATIRLFSEILANGWKEERETEQENLSDFFKGGKKDRLFALVTLAAPTNGTTSYDLHMDPDFDENAVEIPEKYRRRAKMMSMVGKEAGRSRIPEDYASYDMHIDHAQALNARIHTFDSVYYFALPCASNELQEDGTYRVNEKITESLFMKSAFLMSSYQGKTAGGMVLDASWKRNDGLVNTISAGAPFHAPAEKLCDAGKLYPGVWYEMPVIIGDHMCLQGGLTKRRNVRPFYRALLGFLIALREECR